MKALFNKFNRIALLGLIILTATLTATAGNIVITLKNPMAAPRASITYSHRCRAS